MIFVGILLVVVVCGLLWFLADRYGHIEELDGVEDWFDQTNL